MCCLTVVCTDNNVNVDTGLGFTLLVKSLPMTKDQQTLFSVVSKCYLRWKAMQAKRFTAPVVDLKAKSFQRRPIVLIVMRPACLNGVYSTWLL